MEQDISNWKNLWEEKKSSPLDVRTLINRLTSVEKKNKKERIFLGISFPITVLILLLFLPISQSYYYLTAIICIGLGMLLILWQLYKSKLKPNTHEGDLSNQNYIAATIKSLKKKKLITSKYMWMYTFLLLLGLNTGYIELLQQLTIPMRILIHVLLTLSILIFMYVGIKKRMLKNKKEIEPLIDELEELTL
ncbi:hypothetical protein RBU60_12430 [Mesonia sp. MT50]|uniref:Uncharacterized protein n=1 Tax=Mesonia profundi TaxID=3070998 RepID=A0ABU1A3V3_9FLAO|nr:hypothetical protein [Mesonia profundi]MDQ7918382.1 hypothetical protein [Mesonia profundi]